MLNIRGVDKTSHFRPGRTAFLSHSCCCQGEMPMDDAQGPARFYYDMSLYTGSFQIGRDGFGGGFISHDFQEDGITYAQILCLARKMMGSVSTRRSYMMHIFVYGFSYFIFIFASPRFFLLFLPILRHVFVPVNHCRTCKGTHKYGGPTIVGNGICEGSPTDFQELGFAAKKGHLSLVLHQWTTMSTKTAFRWLTTVHCPPFFFLVGM